MTNDPRMNTHYMNECIGFVPAGDGHSDSGKSQFPDCPSCVYFSSRNCGRDTGPEPMFFDQPLI